MLKNIKNCSNFTYGLINRVVITLTGLMEGSILDIARKGHPFISDDYILRDLTVETRKNPGLRIASFIAGFENPENGIAEKIKRLLLCDRDCCKVVSTSGKDSTNKDIIKECLSGNRGIGSRGNAVQLICNMLRDECQEIKDMAKDIVKEVFCEKNIKDMITNKGPVLTYSWLLSTLVLYGEDLYNEDDGYVRKRKYDVEYMDDILDAVDFLFSEKNIDAVLKNKDFMSTLPEVLKGMLRYEKSGRRTTEIVGKLLSDKNADTVLKNEDFISSLPGALEEMLGYASLTGNTAEIIGKLLSEKSTDTVLKNEGFASRLPDMMCKMLRDEGSKEKAADIIVELFSSKKVINILKNEDFVRELPGMIEELLDSRRLRSKSIGIMEKLFSSKENIDVVLKNGDFMSQLPETLEKMLSHTDLAGDTSKIIWKLLFVGNSDAVLKNGSFMSRFRDIIWEMLRNEGSKEKAADIMEKLFSTKENIGVVLYNKDFLNQLPSIINIMLSSESLKEKAALTTQ